MESPFFFSADKALAFVRIYNIYNNASARIYFCSVLVFMDSFSPTWVAFFWGFVLPITAYQCSTQSSFPAFSPTHPYVEERESGNEVAKETLKS